MVELTKYAIILIGCAIIAWGLVRAERIYQFPTFMASIFIMFMWPQINAMITAPIGVTDAMIIRVNIMTSLCIAMCWLGYQVRPNPKFLRKLNISLDEKKLIVMASILTILGLFFNFATIQAAQTIQAGAQWTGRATIYALFAQLSTFGFAIFLLRLLERFTFSRLIGTFIAGYPLWMAVFEGGRRQPTITLFILIGTTLWFTKRWAPPQWLIIPATFLGIYVIPIYGQLRGQMWRLILNQDWQTLRETSDKMITSMETGGVLELRNAAFAMDYATLFSQYEYGAAYWNGIIFQYIPGQLLGREFKSSLMISTESGNSLRYYNYDFPIGTTWTAVGDTYLQFGFFGCLIFALMAMLFKNLWVSSIFYKSEVAFLAIANLASPAMVSVSHGTVKFIQEGIFTALVIFLITRFCRIKIKYDGKLVAKSNNKITANF